jgi:hypothetical protein
MMNADQEESKAGMMACLEKTEARIETGQEQRDTEIETDGEEVEANPVETEAVVEHQEIPKEEAAVHSMRAWQKETVACQETMETRLAFKELTSDDMGPETEHDEKMDARMAEIKDEQKVTVACQEATEANPEKMKLHPGGIQPDSAELESVPLHQEVPMEDAIVKPVGGRKKRHRGRHLAAG